jgi:hypothetical protein
MQPPPPRVLVGRPAPAAAPRRERLGAGQRTRLALEDVELVGEIQNLLPAAVTARMPGATSAVVPDLEIGRVGTGPHHRPWPIPRRDVSGADRLAGRSGTEEALACTVMQPLAWTNGNDTSARSKPAAATARR